MKREAAEKVIAALKEVDAAIEKLGTASREIEDRDERMKIRGEIADLISELHERITMEVVKQFPDLHPDRHLFNPPSSSR